MESQLHHSYAHHAHGDDDPHKPSAVHSMGEDEGGNHHEKKSVLKKVKAKAKKIKETIKKHGHGHEHDYHHNEEDDDEDEEMEEDPEIHGAPVYESAAIRSTVPDHGINVENPTGVGEDRYGTNKGSDRVVGMQGAQGHEQYAGQYGIGLERPITTSGIVYAPEDKNVFSFPAGSHVTDPSFIDKNVERVPEQGVGIGELLHDLQDDPNYARPGTTVVSNYETKITDPTGKAGGEEAEMTSLIHALDNTRVSDESFPKPDDKRIQSGGGLYTGSHDQFAPQPYPTAAEFAPISSTTATSDQSIPKSYDASSRPEELPRDTLTGKSPGQQSGYIEKISNATSAIADKAVSAKNVVASKLGYGGGNEVGKSNNKEGGKPGSSPTEYAHKVAATVTEKLAPVYEKEADAGSSVISKVKGSPTNAAACKGGGRRTEEITGSGEGNKVAASDKGVSVKEYLSEKLKPGDEDKALSEVISETLHIKKKEETGPPLGKVTESEEVARRLGSGTEKPREGDEAIAAGSESTGKGVVDRIKDAVNLWVTKGNQDNNPPDSLGKENSPAGEVEERRLQESVN